MNRLKGFSGLSPLGQDGSFFDPIHPALEETSLDEMDKRLAGYLSSQVMAHNIHAIDADLFSFGINDESGFHRPRFFKKFPRLKNAGRGKTQKAERNSIHF